MVAMKYVDRKNLGIIRYGNIGTQDFLCWLKRLACEVNLWIYKQNSIAMPDGEELQVHEWIIYT